MIIYLIRNTTNGKVYIGQSIHEFKDRYPGNKWWKYTGNKHLKKAFKKYGKDSFEIQILERDVKTEEKLNSLEKDYIKLYSAINPTGYNYQAGGQLVKNRGHHEITVQRLVKSWHGNQKFRLLNNETLTIYEFTNISRFCRLMKLTHALVLKLIHDGDGRKHRRWSSVSCPIKRFVVEKNGIEFEIFDGEIKAFCRKHSIKSTEFFFHLLNSRRIEYVGWTLKKSYIPDVSKAPIEVLKQYDLPD